MLLRQLQYLVTLAKTGHFTRAAEACHVSQPALSSAIQHLEEELGVSIVRRGQRFEGFTPEGERLLAWARRILADWEGLRQEATLSRNQLTGTLRLGAIPTTLPVVPLLTSPCLTAYPSIRHMVFSLSAEQIIRQIDDFELDLGLTYLEDQRLQGFSVLPLYREHYVLLARDAGSIGSRASLDWAEVAALPLCLLTPNMQNRRIIDAAFRQAGVTPKPCVETDSIFALYSHVRYAGLFSVVPRTMLCLFEMRQEVTAIRLNPELSRSIGLIALDREPLSPLLSAAWSIFRNLDLRSRFDALISTIY
jgi:DNA-binding transcriptional LysR family regulator